MQDWFLDEDRHAGHLLSLVPSVVVTKALQLDDEVEGMLFCMGERLSIFQIPWNLGTKMENTYNNW